MTPAQAHQVCEVEHPIWNAARRLSCTLSPHTVPISSEGSRNIFQRRMLNKAPDQPDPEKERVESGQVSVTDHQLLPVPHGFLVNDYSISGLTFLF